jgi:hypothetical protein
MRAARQQHDQLHFYALNPIGQEAAQILFKAAGVISCLILI